MIEARTGHTATQLLDGRVLVAGGVGTQTSEFFANILASAELYDPSSGTWTATGPLLDIRNGHTATLLPDGKVLVFGGGSSSDGDGGPLASAELYDPSTGAWTATGSSIGAGPGRAAILLGNGKVLVVGGSDSNFEPVTLAELYDPATGSWSATGSMIEARSSLTVTLLLDGTVMVAGGGPAVELYDPGTGQWTTTGALHDIRVGHTATLLRDGRVLVAGSMNGTGASSSTEIYDPSSGQWTATGEMLEARLYHTAIVLPDGRVLVVGGVDSVIDGGQVSVSAELYDPVTGSWKASESMPDARRGFTATLLRDGTVLVAGGSRFVSPDSQVGGNALASVEVYDPGSGT